MINLGQKKVETPVHIKPSGNKKEYIQGHHGEKISSSLVEVKITTPVGLIELAAESILLLERGQNGELNEGEVHRQMEVLSAYRFAFVRARVELELELKRKNRELKTYQSSKRRDIILEIAEWRKRVRTELGVSAGWFGQITGTEIEEQLLSDPDYTSKTKEIDKLEADRDTLKGLEECILGHSFILKSVSDRLLQEKMNPNLYRNSQ